MSTQRDGWLTVCLGLAALMGAGVFWRTQNQEVANPAPAKSSTSTGALSPAVPPPLPFPSQTASTAEAPPSPSGLPVAKSQAQMAQEGSPLAAELLNRDQPPQQDLQVLQEIIQQYLTATQGKPGPPIGSNADLVRVLTGKNRLRLTVIPTGHPALGPDGSELLDRWGQPYHLHALGGNLFEIRSAGPDLKLFSADDLVSR